MNAVTAAAILAFTGAQAMTIRTPGCCFGLSASGGPGGVVGQLSDGQNRIGQSGLPTGTFCINNGALTDGNGRGCILTPPTGQFQCDTGAHPSPGFAVDSNGIVTLEGSATFWSCPTGDNGGWNLYSQPLSGQDKCVTVTLQADGCKGSVTSSKSIITSTASVPTSPVQPATSSQVSISTSPVSPIVPVTSTKVTTSTQMTESTKMTTYTQMTESTKVITSIMMTTSTALTTSTKSTTPIKPDTYTALTISTPPAKVITTTSCTTVPVATVPVGPKSSPSTVSTPASPLTPVVRTSTPSVVVITSTPPVVVSTVTPYTSSATSPRPVSPVASSAASTSSKPIQPITSSQPVQPVTSSKSSTQYSTVTAPAPSSTKPASKQTCPAQLSKNFEFPHLIVPVDNAYPSRVYGNQLSPLITTSMSTMFNFDIPASNAGKQCILSFLFPEKSMLETSDYSFSGDGAFEFYHLSKPASKDMSWNSAPALSKSLGNYKLTPGSAADIATFDCPAGQTVGFWMMSHNDAALHYFQDFNPCPIGLYINVV